MFRDCRLARMSDGHYCLVRDLGPVKGGKGLKHHEVVVDFSLRGIRDVSKRAILEGARRIALRVRPRARGESGPAVEQPPSGVLAGEGSHLAVSVLPSPTRPHEASTDPRAPTKLRRAVGSVAAAQGEHHLGA
jgi:hypothetical protein